MNILIVYATTEGRTRKIAAFLKVEAAKMKHTVTLCDVNLSRLEPVEYDAVLIGASVHAEKYPSLIEEYIQKHLQSLNRMHSGFFSVSLTAASDDELLWDELKKLTIDFMQNTGWKPRMVEYVAGALLFTQYDFFKKFIVRQIARKTSGNSENYHDTEYTDWNKLQMFLKKFVDTWTPGPVTIGPDVSDQDAIG